MSRFFLLCLSFLISASVICQAQTFNLLKGNYPDSKKTEMVSTTTWKIGTKGMRSLTLSFNEGDTVVYKISRERQRKAHFVLLDSINELYRKEFEKANIISGAFIANGLGTYLFQIKNHSFLNNNFVVEVKKAPFILPVPPPEKIDSVTISDTSIVIDSVAIRVDSTVYLASTLNFDQSSEFFIPYNFEKEYDCYIVRPKDIILRTFTTNKKNNGSVKKDKLDCEPVRDKGDLVIYLTEAEQKWEMTDSLATLYIGKDVKYCQIRTTGSKSIIKNLVVSNNERVPGKHLHVLVKEIVKSRKVTIKKVPVKKDAK